MDYYIRQCEAGHLSLNSGDWECPWCEVERLKADLADADACIQSHDALRGKVVDLQRERDEARREAEALQKLGEIYEAKIEAALRLLKAFLDAYLDSHTDWHRADLKESVEEARSLTGGRE